MEYIILIISLVGIVFGGDFLVTGDWYLITNQIA